MKIQVGRAAFETALGIAVACCGREKSLPQLGLVHLTSSGDTLYFHATDMDRSVRSQVGGEIDGDLDIYVDGQLLARIISKLRGETLNLTLKGDKLELKGGQTKINTAAPASYPSIHLCEEASEYKLGFTPAVFTEFGKALLLGTSQDERDMERAYRNIIQVRAKDGTATGRASDQVRIAEVVAPCSTTAEVEILIPLLALRTLFLKVAGADEQLRLGQDQNHIFAVYGTSLYSFRKSTAKFPNLDLYFSNRVFDRASCQVNTDEFANTLDLAAAVVAQAVAQGARPAIIWELEDNGLRIMTSNVAGDTNELVETSVEGEPLQAIYNIHQILPIVTQAGTEVLDLSFAEDKTIPGLDNFPLRIGYKSTIKASFDLQSLTK